MQHADVTEQFREGKGWGLAGRGRVVIRGSSSALITGPCVNRRRTGEVGGGGPNNTYERERREEGAFKNQIHRHSVRENQFINTVLDGSKMVHLVDLFL